MNILFVFKKVMELTCRLLLSYQREEHGRTNDIEQLG